MADFTNEFLHGIDTPRTEFDYSNGGAQGDFSFSILDFGIPSGGGDIYTPANDNFSCSAYPNDTGINGRDYAINGNLFGQSYRIGKAIGVARVGLAIDLRGASTSSVSTLLQGNEAVTGFNCSFTPSDGDLGLTNNAAVVTLDCDLGGTPEYGIDFDFTSIDPEGILIDSVDIRMGSTGTGNPAMIVTGKQQQHY